MTRTIAVCLCGIWVMGCGDTKSDSDTGAALDTGGVTPMGTSTGTVTSTPTGASTGTDTGSTGTGSTPQCEALIEADDFADGVVERVTRLVYSPFPLLTLAEVHDGTSLTDPVLYSEAYTYDANGNEVQSVIDDGMGVVVTTWTTYDAADNPVRAEQDYDGDGVADISTVYLYDQGVLSELEYDDGMDGTIDLRLVYAYDGDGRLVGADGDYGDDGSIDEQYTLVYDNPAPDLSGTLTYDFGVDGEPEQVEVFTYDPGALDQLVFYTLDDDGDGLIEVEYNLVYGATNDVELLFGTAFVEGAFEYGFEQSTTYVAPGKADVRITEYQFNYTPMPEYVASESFIWTCP